MTPAKKSPSVVVDRRFEITHGLRLLGGKFFCLFKGEDRKQTIGYVAAEHADLLEKALAVATNGGGP